MTQEEARKQAYSIWQTWDRRHQKNDMLGLIFYQYLENNHSHLMSFTHQGDRYPVVRSWVVQWQRVDDAMK